MPYFTDQLHRKIFLDGTPQRIISLVPSQTELLFDLGLENNIVGITNYCIHPKVKKIGGTKDFNLEKIAALAPDLIIANKEENEQVLIEALAQKFPVWLSDIFTLNESFEMMRSIGEMTATENKAEAIIADIKTEFALLKKKEGENKKRVLYLIWREPYMLAGAETFISNMLHFFDFEQIPTKRYPIFSAEEIIAFQPDVIFLSSEPYPFKTKHIQEFKNLCPKAQVLIVDGELFSWYGSRLKHSARYFLALMNKS